MKYVLSHKSIPVIPIDLDEGTGTIVGLGNLVAPEHLPVGVAYTGNFVDRQALNAWWTGRAIPASRSGLREALETLNITSSQLLPARCYGLSLSDQYWVCPEGSGLRWEDVNFFENPFSDDIGNILFSGVSDKADINLMSPDNTSDGWLKKKWVIADSNRYLIKGGSNPAQQEPYNEVLASAVMRRLGVQHAAYTLSMIDGFPYSVCEDFISKDTELITAWHIMQTQRKPNHVSSYQHYVNCCTALGIPGVIGELDRMLVVDYIIANTDRHYNNFGAVRNADTLEWISAAPVYDCGTSMWYDQFTQMIQTLTKQSSKPFKSDHEEQIELVTSFEWLDISSLQGVDEEFREILKESEFIDASRCSALCYGLRRRVKLIGEHAKKK